MAVCSLLRLDPAEPQADMPFHIRRATPDDISALMEMKNQMAIADGAVGLFDATVADWLRGGFGPSAQWVAIVAECAGAVTGMAIFNEQNFAGWATPPIYVQDLYVMPEYRRRGIARALLAEVATEAQARNSRLIYLNVHEDNAARRLYDELGFAPAHKCMVYALMGPQIAALGSRAVLSRPTDRR
jgi:ribosomal protein S18 acetylase RimI-like enzyme